MVNEIIGYRRRVPGELSVLRGMLIAAAVLFMANLGALIDLVLHPEIPYFHDEHLIVGGITALMTAVLFALLYRYSSSYRLSEKRLRSLFDVTVDFIHILDTHGVILQTNPATIDSSGYQKDELVGHRIDEYLTPASKKTFEIHFPLLMERGTCRVEVEFILKDGRIRVMDCQAIALRDRKGSITSVVLVQRDMTERKQMEEAREKLVVQLQDALERINTLRGLIPICASCKKVRDDKGYWSQVDAYFSEHSLAEFSHGICPDCAKRLYPEYYNENNGKS